MTRTEAREAIMKIIFQIDAQKDWEQLDLHKYLNDFKFGKQEEYANQMLNGIAANIQKIDDVINQNSEGWPVSRLMKTDLAIMRIAIWEILSIQEIPKSVSINEAVELAKVYGTDQSAKFVNAVLKKIGE